MSIVNVTSTNNTVSVTESGTVIIGLIGVGPQGPGSTTPGSITLAELSDVDATGVVNESLLTYNATSSKFVADSNNTILTLTDGGNF